MTFNPLDLSGRHILVTGASGGIGRAAALLLSKLGAQVTLHGRDADRLAGCLAELDGAAAQPHAIEAFDLADLDAVPAWVREVAARHGKLAGLVHCAGIQVTKPVRVFDRETFDETLHVNLGSALALARGFRHRQSYGGSGAIVFVSSIAGFIGQPGNVVYAASKGGLMAATRGLAMELLRDGIRVNCVAPALIESDMAARSRAGMTQDQFDHMVEQHPMGLGKPEDVANAIAFLLADTARWITGETLLLDGGYLAR